MHTDARRFGLAERALPAASWWRRVSNPSRHPFPAGTAHPAVLFLSLLCVLCASTVQSHAADPVVNRIVPRGGQRGTEVDLVIRGQRLADAEELLFNRPGIEVLSFEPVDESRINAKIRIAEDTVLGPRAAYIRTRTGISRIKLFSVGALPETRENEPNNTLAQATEIEFGTTVNGVAQNEDLDVFAFEAKAGQRISVEVEGIRLGDFLFDSYVAILDSDGFELATCDDVALLRQDACATIVAPKDGMYYAAVREASYAGNGNCMYRLHVGDFPRPAVTFPLGGAPGETLDLQLITGEKVSDTFSVTIPEEGSASEMPGGWNRPGVVGFHPQDEGGAAPSPNFLRISAVPNAFEAEPNNRHAQATPFTPPAALNGILGEDRDQDCYSFAAKQNERYYIAAFARQVRSPVDPVVRINLKGGRQIAANDDTTGPDSLIDFTAPEDGEYVITVHDHLRVGSPDAVYRVEVWPASEVHAAIATLPRNFEYIVVPRGRRMATIVNALRINFASPLEIGLDTLPTGVALHARTMRQPVARAPIVFEAAPDAPLGATFSGVQLIHPDPGFEIGGTLYQDVELVLGQNNVPYMCHSIDRVPVVVVEEAPFSIEAVEPQAPLVRSGSMRLKVRVQRAEGFDKPIRLRVPWVPPGVGASQSIVVQPNQSEAEIPFNANGNAALSEWPIVVLAEADSGRGAVRVSSQLFSLTVEQPFVSLAVQPTTVEQGQATSMFGTLTRTREFEGDVNLQLRGFPSKVSADRVDAPADQQEITFSIATDGESPPGKHRNIFCLATVTVNGEPVVHRLPAAELRIDKPLPAVAQQPPPAKPEVAEKKPKEPAPRRLTRLEKLREEYEARKEKDDQDSGTDEEEGQSQ